MLEHLEKCGIETCFDRFDKQGTCDFGLAGTCCTICNMGPCRITPKAPNGVCGADKDLIVARNLLRSLAGGVAGHGGRSREVLLALKAAARRLSPRRLWRPRRFRAEGWRRGRQAVHRRAQADLSRGEYWRCSYACDPSRDHNPFAAQRSGSTVNRCDAGICTLVGWHRASG